MSFIYFLIRYSVVSIKRTGGNKRSGWAEFFHLLHEKRVQGGDKYFYYMENEIRVGQKLQIVKRP
jgi:hypothetical protein